MPHIRNRVLLVLGLAGGIALGFGGFLEMAPNRLARGTALPIWELSPVAGLIIALPLIAFALLAFVAIEKGRSIAALISAALLLYACLVNAALLAQQLATPSMPALRLSLGSAFWIPTACALFSFVDSMQRLKLKALMRGICFTLLFVPFLLLAGSSFFAALSLAKEFKTHRSAFIQALFDHILLVGAALSIALLIAIPIILVIWWKMGLQKLVYASLGVIQAAPSIALFGLLIAPLSALVFYVPVLAQFGISGTGRTPAIIALVLYSLLPLVRNGVTGLAAVSPDVKDAAMGLGFTFRERVLRIDLPLAMPALLSGLRVVTVQAIGLASIAALIGAGGLGTFVFQGIGQYALDLVLVGAIPIILLAVGADLGFQLLLSLVRTRA
jgi:osmoprotectant transport system permease protein